jgi:hypothetical protein
MVVAKVGYRGPTGKVCPFPPVDVGDPDARRRFGVYIGVEGDHGGDYIVVALYEVGQLLLLSIQILKTKNEQVLRCGVEAAPVMDGGYDGHDAILTNRPYLALNT